MIDLNFPNAVLDERDYYGHPHLLDSIQQILLNGRRVPILILGERRIGKTSLQNIAIQQLLSSDPEHFRVLNIEPRGIASFSQFTQAVLRQLSAWIRKNSGESLTLPQTIESNEEFEYVVSMVVEHMKKEIVLCVDEFDEVVRGLGEQQLRFLVSLFYYLIEDTSLPIHLFFTMTHIPDQMEEEVPSTLISISEIFELPPLTLDETAQLTRELTKSRFDWPDATLRELYRLSGGHPYFTKLILSCLTVAAPAALSHPVPVTAELLVQAVKSAVRDPKADHVMKNLYKVHFSADEKNLLLFLAQRQGPAQLAELEKAGKTWPAKARKLAKRHYLMLDEEAACIDYKIAFFSEWLRGWMEFDLQCEEFCNLRSVLSRADIEVDEAVSHVRVCGRDVHLSSQEYKIMRCLAANVDRLVTRNQLAEATWDTLDGVSDQGIDQAVYRLRKKLSDQGQYIETIAGRGFIMHRAVLLNSKTD